MLLEIYVLSNLYGVQLLLSSLMICFTFGLILGSFLNVCIYRIPRGVFWKSQRSFCTQCQHKIPFYLNIPIISYLLLRGKSSCCQTKISLQYPIVELLTAILLCLLFSQASFLSKSYSSLTTINLNEMIRLLHGLLFISIMIVCSFIDLNFRIIPDKISLPAILATPLVILVHPELSWKSGLLGVLLGGGVIYALAWFYYFLRRQEGIGMGDAKLLAVIGGWLGYEAIFPTLFYSSILGSLISISILAVTRKLSLKAEIPFGPFLALGALIQLLSPISFWSLMLF